MITSNVDDEECEYHQQIMRHKTLFEEPRIFARCEYFYKEGFRKSRKNGRTVKNEPLTNSDYVFQRRRG